MQNNIFSKINVSTRLIILLLLILSVFIANSIYLLIFLSFLCVLFIILTNKSVKFYIDSIKNVKFLLLFVFITYIIIDRNILFSFMLMYKIGIVILLVKQFCLTINFISLTNGIVTLFNLIGFKFVADKISYQIVIFIYFVNVYIKTKQEIFNKYDTEKKLKYQFSFKYNVFPRLLLAMSKIERFESSLKIKFYKPRLEEKNIESKIALSIFLILFITIVLKEVIL